MRGQSEADEILKDIIPLSFAGLDFSKINFGMAIYGRGYELAGASSLRNADGCRPVQQLQLALIVRSAYRRHQMRGTQEAQD